MSDDLKPCPFCGGSVRLEQTDPTMDHIHGRRDWWGVVCRNTENVGGSCAIQQLPSASKEAAINRWNTRAALAAAQPPAAMPVPTDARWYCVSAGGLATLCADQIEAIEIAAESDRDYPRHGPHRAVRLFEAAQPPAAMPGWQWVPVEPTEAMLTAGLKRKALALWKDGASPLRASTANLRPVQEVAALQWAALLAAAPTPQAQSVPATGAQPEPIAVERERCAGLVRYWLTGYGQVVTTYEARCLAQILDGSASPTAPTGSAG